MEQKPEAEISGLGLLPQLHDWIVFTMTIHYGCFITKSLFRCYVPLHDRQWHSRISRPSLAERTLQKVAYNVVSLKVLFLGELYYLLKMLHGPSVNKSADSQRGTRACHRLTFAVLALLEKSKLEQRAGVPQGRAGRLESATVWMWMLPVMQETPSVLYSYPCSDESAGLQAWLCRGFKGQCAQEPGLWEQSVISAMCTFEKVHGSGLGFKTISLSRVLDVRAVNLKISHLWELVLVFFLPTPNTLRFATLYAALVCAVLEGSGLVSPRSCQSQGPIWQKRGVLLLVLPLLI